MSYVFLTGLEQPYWQHSPLLQILVLKFYHPFFAEIKLHIYWSGFPAIFLL